MPKFEPVESRAIKETAHEDGVMYIKFHSGKVYAIDDATEEEHEKLRNAGSIGKHYNQHYRGKARPV